MSVAEIISSIVFTISGPIFETTRRLGKPLMRMGEHRYYMSYRSGKKTTWRCIKQPGRLHCKAVATVISGRVFMKHDHNHDWFSKLHSVVSRSLFIHYTILKSKCSEWLLYLCPIKGNKCLINWFSFVIIHVTTSLLWRPDS